MLSDLTKIKNAKTGRCSSWDTSGRNADWWKLQPGESKVIADIQGSGCITHIWMTQLNHYRDVLIKITWDDAQHPSVLCPLGDFFGLGHGIVNSYESLLFSSSVRKDGENAFEVGAALNCYVQMPFRTRAKIELINESNEEHLQYFYVDYEIYPNGLDDDVGYFHAEFRRENPFGGWGEEIPPPAAEAKSVANTGKDAWENNYVILDTKGKGHYIGCNISVSNFRGAWWGEGDDMIWVDGYKWPPDLHGTGSEDYLGQAWEMQDNAFLRNGSSIWEGNTKNAAIEYWLKGGYQTSYVHHLENPVRFLKEIKVTIEHGHGNHLRNEMSSVAYWYADKPYKVVEVPPVEKRQPVLKDSKGKWLHDKTNQLTSHEVKLTDQMLTSKEEWAKKQAKLAN